jgi:hypothetical protein
VPHHVFDGEALILVLSQHPLQQINKLWVLEQVPVRFCCQDLSSERAQSLRVIQFTLGC